MNRQGALKIALVLVGLSFVAGIYAVGITIHKEPATAMMLSLYATLGVFLLIAARDPSAHRSLIAFTAWSSFAHAGVMALQAMRNWIHRRELIGSLLLVIIGITLIALTREKHSGQQASAARA